MSYLYIIKRGFVEDVLCVLFTLNVGLMSNNLL